MEKVCPTHYNESDIALVGFEGRGFHHFGFMPDGANAHIHVQRELIVFLQMLHNLIKHLNRPLVSLESQRNVMCAAVASFMLYIHL